MPLLGEASGADAFKTAVIENRRGLYLAHRNTLVRAIRDPDLAHRNSR
jgi:hypothetical protein